MLLAIPGARVVQRFNCQDKQVSFVLVLCILSLREVGQPAMATRRFQR